MYKIIDKTIVKNNLVFSYLHNRVSSHAQVKIRRGLKKWPEWDAEMVAGHLRAERVKIDERPEVGLKKIDHHISLLFEGYLRDLITTKAVQFWTLNWMLIQNANTRLDSKAFDILTALIATLMFPTKFYGSKLITFL